MVAPRLNVSPSSLDFGLQPMGMPSNAQRITAMNTGGLQLTVSTVTVNNPEFTLNQGCTLAPLGTPGFTDSQCSIDVQFTPASGGPRSGQITIVSDGGNANVSLSGEGPAPAISVTPSSINFGSVLVGSTGTRRQVVVNNTGSAPLRVTAAAVSGANPGDFTLRTNLPCVVQPNGSSARF